MIYLSADQLSHWYRPEEILFENLNFQILPGSFTRIGGDNGKGKSTLLKILAQKLKPRRGTVVSGLSESEIAWLPQLESLFFYVPLKLRDLLDKDCATPLTQSLDLDKNWNEASGGERKRVLLEKILAGQPKLLLLDEPFNHLDMGSKEALLTLLDERRKKSNLSVVLVSHEERALMGDRISQEIVW